MYFGYKSVHSFRVTWLLSGQYNTKGYGTVTDVMYVCIYYDLLSMDTFLNEKIV